MFNKKIENGNEEKEPCTIDEMPEIYCAISISFDEKIEIETMKEKLSKLQIGEIKICRPRLSPIASIEIACVNNERFWYLEEALTKMFSYVDHSITEFKKIVEEHNGNVLIDVAFYQYGTYPALVFSGENMRKIHYLDADISIDPY